MDNEFLTEKAAPYAMSAPYAQEGCNIVNFHSLARPV